ncbi:MAG: DUF4870 domain-containing protein [Myxococcaceae bacterium]|nr:DUF4870 domain-containing protein [Myxococcaceae bacterium]
MTPQNQQDQQLQSVGSGTETVRDQDKVMLILSYLGLLALIPLLTVKDSEFVKWHAKQGLVMLGPFVILSIITPIPILGWLLGCAGIIACWVFDIMAMVKALKGERWKIPVVGDIATKL